MPATKFIKSFLINDHMKSTSWKISLPSTRLRRNYTAIAEWYYYWNCKPHTDFEAEYLCKFS